MTDCAADMVTAQVLVPVQLPLQPVKMEPTAGVAVRVTAVFAVYASVQSLPQVMPAGVLLTVPIPVPALVTVRRYVWGVKVAVTDCAADIVREQVLVPVQLPLQPVKMEPTAGVAVRVTAVLAAYASVQSLPQLTPTGLLLTVPAPVPAFVTVREYVWVVKVAVTDCAADMVTEQVLVPVQLPLHPVKVEPAAAVAVRVTAVLSAYASVQSLPQLTPTGLLLTVPVPVPALVTVRGYVTGGGGVVPIGVVISV